MLVIALELRLAVKKYFQNHKLNLEDNKLSNTDWRQLCTIIEFLELFSQATLYTKGDSAAIDQVLFSIDVLIIHFQYSLVSKTFLQVGRYLLYNRPNTKRIKISLLGLIKGGKSLTSII